MKKLLFAAWMTAVMLNAAACSTEPESNAEPVGVPSASPAAEQDFPDHFPDPPKKYPSETAVQNGDVVYNRSRLANLDKWDRFLNNLKNKKEDHIRLVSYTIEGDAILDELNFNGTRIKYTHDSTRDNFGSGIKETTFCRSMDIKAKELKDVGLVYVLNNCESEEIGSSFRFYAASDDKK
ncbi:DUF4362 domain-containing protein [Paenibacillus sp. FJAT-26967]|uniref:DUF4362 domain-containing protein n=1 Tax=Paenibacillus sp. FJAT-26967 TaxID=1729690 RepID=UPI000838022D|nr:DUF4362 domain-containing protein [Paenibacillus sp. FJAT-26967]